MMPSGVDLFCFEGSIQIAVMCSSMQAAESACHMHLSSSSQDDNQYSIVFGIEQLGVASMSPQAVGMKCQ